MPSATPTPEVAGRVDRVLLAEPRGFCAGVEMAIKALAWLVRAFDVPVYCYHEIVHNKLVVERFEALGVIFVDNIAEVPDGKPRAREGYQIVYGGHAGHEEAEGTIAVAPDVIHRVERPDEIDALPDLGDDVAILAQTTLSHRDWEGVVDAASERWSDLWSPGRSDLCFATTNRQGALLELVDRCDAVVVIGSTNSSNTRALVHLATEAGCERVEWINRAEELPGDLFGTVGVTAGASAPEEVVDAVVLALDPVDGVETVRHTDEDEYFPPPRNLRDLLEAIRGFAGLGFGAPPPSGRLDDRAIDASDALTALDRLRPVG